MPERRVVITGMGVVTPVGNGVETFWSNLKNGVSGIRTIDAFDTSGYDCKIGGQVRDFDPKSFFKNPKDVRRTDRFTHLAMAASKMAVADSGIDIDNLKERDRFGVIVSTGIGGLKTLQDQLQILVTKGPSRNSPFTIPMLISNMATGVISMEFDLRGPNLCIVTACATSNNAIGESWRMIKFGDADIFLAGGSEASVVAIGLAGFSAMRALSTRNDEPERASRPFDRDRDGFVMREGARRKNLLRTLGLRNVCRRLPHDRSAAGWQRRRARHGTRARTRTHFTRPGRLHQRPRHLHRHRRSYRDARDQKSLRRLRSQS